MYACVRLHLCVCKCAPLRVWRTATQEDVSFKLSLFSILGHFLSPSVSFPNSSLSLFLPHLHKFLPSEMVLPLSNLYWTLFLLEPRDSHIYLKRALHVGSTFFLNGSMQNSLCLPRVGITSGFLAWNMPETMNFNSSLLLLHRAFLLCQFQLKSVDMIITLPLMVRNRGP